MSLLQYADSDRTKNLREVRSSSKYGGKAFSHVGPRMWNLFPRTVRDVVDTKEFKKALKIFFMTIASVSYKAVRLMAHNS